MQTAEERKETPGVNSTGCGSVCAGDQLKPRANPGAFTTNGWGVTKTLHRSQSRLLCIWFHDKGPQQEIQIKTFLSGGKGTGSGVVVVGGHGS